LPWTNRPNILIGAAIRLYVVSLFAGTLFGFPANATILVLGFVMTMVVLLGGAWAPGIPASVRGEPAIRPGLKPNVLILF